MGSQELTKELYREAISQFATGVTVITANGNDGPVGMTANAVCSLSLDPLLLLVCFDRGSRTLTAVRESKRFAVNVLNESQRGISDHFAGKQDSFGTVAHSEVDGVPVVDGSLASVVCKLERWVEGGDHLIGIGEVSSVRSTQGAPLLWFGGQYHQLPVDKS